MPAQCADSGFRGGAQPVNLQYFKSKGLVNPVVVSPDAGGVKRAKTFMEGAFPPPRTPNQHIRHIRLGTWREPV